MALTKVTGSVIKDNVSLSGNVSVGGTLTYQDVTNVDALGIGTFRTGIKVLAGQVDVGSNIKLGNAGVITATSFVGSGANLTGITQTTINNNADNRIITGSGTANTLEGEANLTFNGSQLTVAGKIACDVNSDISMSGSADGQLVVGGNGYTGAISLDGTAMNIYHNSSSRGIIFGTNETERLRIDSSGNVTINTGNLTIPDSIIHSGDTDTKIAFTNNQIDLQCAGASRAYINNYALYIRSGFPLAFLSSSGATPSIKSGGTNAQDLLLTSGTGNPTRLQIESGGNVRVSDEHLRFDTTGKGIIFGIDGGSNRPSIIGNYTSSSDNNMVFNVTGSERLRITSAGYLQQHKLIAVSYSDTREIALNNVDLTTSNFYNYTNFASDSSILDSNGHFVAPVHGIYRLYVRVTTDGDAGNRANIRLRKNGTTINEAYSNDSGGGIGYSVSSEIIMELNANEYMDIQVGQLHTRSGNQHKVVNFHMLG